MPQFTDGLGITLSLDLPPQRIISLVPSQTELLHYFGLDQQVVGITKFCVHPKDWHKKKTRIGGTKNVHLDVIRNLQPDLVIANKEENVKEQVEEIRSFCPVYTTHVGCLHDALEMIFAIGRMVNKERAATVLNNCISGRFSRISHNGPLLRVAYLIWKDPYIAAGGDTFIHDMMLHCRLVNVFSGEKRYPQIQPAQLKERGCDIVLLSSEPFPFKERDLHDFTAHTGIPAMLVDGEMFSWYGSRLLQAGRYFSKLMKELVKVKSQQ